MKRIALTGIMGAGKSTFGSIITEWKIPFISADSLARKALIPHSKIYPQLLQLLGSNYLNPDGSFNRHLIARKAFQHPPLLSQIESIIHPFVWEALLEKQNFFSAKEKEAVFCEIPLLFEKKLDNFFDLNILLAIEPKQQKMRLERNRHFSEKEIQTRMKFQSSQEEKIKKADYIIWNNSSMKELEKNIQDLMEKLGIDIKKD